MKEKRAFRVRRGNKSGMSGGKVEVCVRVWVCVHAYTMTLNLSVLGANSPFLCPCVTHIFPFHLILTRIPLCNCALIFQCQSGMCPQPCYLLRSQLFLISLPLPFHDSHIFLCALSLSLMDLFGWRCGCVPLVNKSVFLCECLFVFILLGFLPSAPLVSFVCGRGVDKYN